MPFPSKSVANEILTLAKRDGISVSPMKLQKLVFYAHGWNLAVQDAPLIDEQIECWQFGPVVRTLFMEFKEYGPDSIPRLARRRKFTKKGWQTSEPRLPETAVNESRIINLVWDAYKDFSAIKLSNMTHEEGTPWARVFSEHGKNPPRGTDIPAQYIKQYFDSLMSSDE